MKLVRDLVILGILFGLVHIGGLAAGFLLNSAPTDLGFNPSGTIFFAGFVGAVGGFFCGWGGFKTVAPVDLLDFKIFFFALIMTMFALHTGISYMSGHIVGLSFDLGFILTSVSAVIFLRAKAKHKKADVH